MPEVAIRVEKLGKLYRIGQLEPYKTLRDTLARAALAPLRAISRARSTHEPLSESPEPVRHLWALKDVSFEISKGQIVGIVGRNGAGKTTLLKILSRITEPTEGRAEIRGRVGALLEVGTGFHPELTGHENVYLNGAVLGMTKSEIDQKFDEIVSFAELENFMDTPVKRYSSGMWVRLAFAVAAHLRPEILLVDEVLAVGDAAFQKKCLGKMGDVAKLGRTVLFVSHNLGAIQSLTERCLLIDNGRLISFGQTDGVVEDYLRSFHEDPVEDTSSLPRSKPQHGSKIMIRRIEPMPGTPMGFFLGQDLSFRITLHSKIQREGLRFGATVSHISGYPVFTTFSPADVSATASNTSTYELTLRDTRIAPGTYTLSLSIGEGQQHEAKTEYDVITPGPVFMVSSFSKGSVPIFHWERAWGSIAHPLSTVRPVEMGGEVEHARGH